MNYKHLDAASSRLHHHLKSFMNRHKREHSWVIISVKKKKWRNPHTKKLKYCSYAIFDEHNNKFGKGWSPGSSLMNFTNIHDLPMLKNDLSDQPFINYYIF